MGVSPAAWGAKSKREPQNWFCLKHCNVLKKSKQPHPTAFSTSRAVKIGQRHPMPWAAERRVAPAYHPRHLCLLSNKPRQACSFVTTGSCYTPCESMACGAASSEALIRCAAHGWAAPLAARASAHAHIGTVSEAVSARLHHWYFAAVNTSSYCCAALSQLRSCSMPRSCRPLNESGWCLQSRRHSQWPAR